MSRERAHAHIHGCSGQVRRLSAVNIAGETPFYCGAEFPSNIGVRLNKVAEDCTDESAAWNRSMLSYK